MARRYWRAALPAIVLLAAVVAASAADRRLADAVEDRDFSAARALLEAGVPVDAAQPDGTTALHWAVRHGARDVAARLLRAGADPNATNRYGVTPLALAAGNGHPGLAAALLDAGASPHAATPYGETPLMTAARTGNPEVVRLLIEAGADVDAKEAWREQTALMWAAAERNAAAAQVLIEAGADVAARSQAGMTPLLFAARSGDIDTVRTLLTGGADIDEAARDAIPRRPADDDGENDDGAEADAAAPLPPRLGSTPLATAIRNVHFDLAAWLVAAGADVNRDGPRGTALHGLVRARNCERTAMPCPEQAAALGSLDLARLLLAHGADVNARMTARPPTKGTYDGNFMSLVGATPLLLAVKASDTALMRLLLDQGADVRLGNDDNTTPLLVAAGIGFLEGQVPAEETDALEAVRMLVERGESVTQTNDMDETALHGAAYRGANSIVTYLVERGARLDAADDKGLLPVTVADGFRRRGGFQAHDHTAALLRELMGPDAPPRQTDQGAR
ncbi:MAG: ankyrin repeat domain-containing protein [Acidobacteria bacterium]|nr:ankyrin repeat domain-containing protein [Acidobacteriota bacterium]